MKLRIRGDSLRLRLMQSEVASFAEKGLIEESTSFGGAGELTYAMTFGAAGTTVTAKMEGSRIEVSVPPDVARAWASSDAVGIEGAQRVAGDRTLRIAIEKDYACLKPRENEDEGDAFPHPKAGTTTEC